MRKRREEASARKDSDEWAALGTVTALETSTQSSLSRECKSKQRSKDCPIPWQEGTDRLIVP